MKRMITLLFLGLAMPALNPVFAGGGTPVGTTFTYQGQLRDGAQVANGLFDFEVRLHDQAGGGSVVGGPLMLQDIPVENGVFSLSLDFGASFTGQARWLGIGVRDGASNGAFDLLSPRQALTAAPYALHALSGNPGPQGPAGPSGIVQAQGFAGAIATINFGGAAAPFVFAGPTTTVAVASNQRLLGSASATFGHSANVNIPLSIALCHRLVGQGGAPTAFVGTALSDSVALPVPVKTTLATSATSAALPAGNYDVGFCVKNKSSNINLDANSMVNGWVMVLN